jgi:probable HAF family extracellular repeat protein
MNSSHQKQVFAQGPSKHPRYKLIDLGTFGGPASSASNGLDGILNAHGTAVGWANTSTRDPYPAFCFVNCFVTHAFQTRDGVVTDLGVLRGGASSLAVWIRKRADRGEFPVRPNRPIAPRLSANHAVLGTKARSLIWGLWKADMRATPSRSTTEAKSSGSPSIQFLISFPWRRRASTPRRPGHLWNTVSERVTCDPLGSSPSATPPSDMQGQRKSWEKTVKKRLATFVTMLSLCAPLAFPIGLAAQEQQNKKPPHYTIKVLGTLGGTFSEAVGINNRGSLAGISTLPGDNVVHAFLWKNGVITDLGTLGGPNSVAPEAEPQPNAKGEVAGASDTATPDPNGEDFCGFATHLICLPFIWEKGVLTVLPTLGGNNAEAWQINNGGQVVGTAENGTPDPSCKAFELEAEPVIWERGGIQRLPTVSGDLDGAAQAINDRGQAVGISTNCLSELFVFPSHAALWTGSPAKVGVTDLGNLGSTKFNIAFGINNRGHIVGQSGVPGDMAFHAFLWSEGTMTDLGTLPGDVVSWAETINSDDQAVGTSFDTSGNMHPFLWENGVMTDLNTLIPPGFPWLLLEALGNNDRGQIVGYALQTATGEVHAYVLTPCDEERGHVEGCEEGGDENTVLQASPAARDVPNRTLPPSLMRRMGRYRFSGLAIGPRN